MIGSFEENVIEYCGPTLAGLKAGSCFTCFRRQFPDAQQLIRDVDRIACEKGVRLCVLADKQDYLLVYCYRPAMIDVILSRPEVIDFLDGMGYSIKEQDWLPVCHRYRKHQHRCRQEHLHWYLQCRKQPSSYSYNRDCRSNCRE